MLKLLTLALSATGALAALRAGTPSLLGRGDSGELLPCSAQGQKDCGKGCIDLGWTCCPDGAGGCGPSDVCNMGNNGQYNCCPRGKVCDGPGGVTTHDGKTLTSTIVSTQTVTSAATKTVTVSSQPPPASSSSVVSPPVSKPTTSTPPVSKPTTTTPPPGTGVTQKPTTKPTTTSVVIVTAGAAQVVPGFIGVVAGAAALLL